MDYEPLLTSLCSMLEARLTFRRTPFIESLQAIVSQAIKAGNRQNSRLGIVFAQAHEREMPIRAELIIDELRKARSSWSPKQLTDGRHEIRSRIIDLFRANISQAAYLAAEIGNFNVSGRDPVTQHMAALFMQSSDPASKAALSLVEAAIAEVIAAAENDLAARQPGERPSYVYQNTFNAPVAAIAQGNSSVQSVSQTVATATPEQLANAVAKIIEALPDGLTAKGDLVTAEQELRKGSVPFGLLNRVMSVLGGAEDIATRAPGVIEHIQRLANMLGLS